MVLNITNGDYFNNYFIDRFGGVAIPFCEAMMDGDTTAEIYSDAFIKLRASALHISEQEYRAKMLIFDLLSKNTYSKIHLWFGKDTFCQMNLLALLAYLEQKEYQGKLQLTYIDDETFEILDADIDVALGSYQKTYEEVLIKKSMLCDLGILDANAIDLYFDYLSDSGMLSDLIKKNTDKNENDLISLLLEASKDYGLSDLQAKKLIYKYR